MSWFTTAVTYLRHELLFISWRDYAEIFFFSLLVYYFLQWLNQDKKNSLVFWFYGYTAILFGAYFTQLNSISLVLTLSSPIALMIFIMVHEQTLQKNFVTLTNISPKAVNHHHWLEELMQACLHAVNKNREIICVIERADSIDFFISASVHFNAKISQKAVELLMNTIPENQPVALWVNHAGKLLTINPIWHVYPDEAWISPEIKALHKWKQDAIFITKKSDAIVFALSTLTRCFDVIIEGKTINNLPAGHAFELLKKYTTTHTPDQPLPKKTNAPEKNL
jgi:DNA integrity scanning protein DisA with diadenylate cyclase activity